MSQSQVSQIQTPQAGRASGGSRIVKQIFGFLTQPFVYLWWRRQMIFRLYMVEMKSSSAGTMLGNIWPFLYPFIYFCSYIFLFVVVFRVNFAGLTSLEYMAMILVGLAPALTFAQSIAGGVSSIVGNAALLKGTLVDIEAIPVRYVLTSQSTLVTGMAIAIVFFLIAGRAGVTTPLLILIWVLQCLWAIGLLWILAPFNVFLRDIGQIVPALITPLVMISPVAYPVADAPAAIKALLWFNPFFYFISCYQDIIVFGRLPSISVFSAYVTLSLGFFIFGFRVISRAKTALLDSM